MKEQLMEIASRNNKEVITNELRILSEGLKLKIGFIGMYSSGKTSLINSILGTKLPEGASATTKSICIIESVKDIVKNQYFIEENGKRRVITFMEFDAILHGEKKGVAGVYVPVSKNLPENILFVDTPGVDHFAADETDLTYRYLSLLDAAVVCVNINDGTLKQQVLEFISRPELKNIYTRMVFALTHSDLKLMEKQDIIKQQIVEQVDELFHDCDLYDLDFNRLIFPVSARAENNADYVFDFLNNGILSKIKQMRLDRETKIVKQIAEQLYHILNDELENTKYNSTELIKKQDTICDEIEKTRTILADRKEAVEDLRITINNRIHNVIISYKESILSASEATLSEIISQMLGDIQMTLESMLKRYSSSFSIPSAFYVSVAGDLSNRMASIESKKDLAVTSVTAITTAFIAPGASVAANTAEGAAGMIMQRTPQAISNIVKNTLVKKTDYKQTGGDAEEPGTFGKVLSSFGEIVRTINPLEHVGNWVAKSLKDTAYENFAGFKAAEIADNSILLIEEDYYIEIIQPVENILAEQKRNLENILGQRKEGIDDFVKQREKIAADMSILQGIISE